MLACYRYIEINPVRDGMVEHPAEYRWSSYRTNAQGEASALRCAHPLYQALSQDDQLRAESYRELFRYQLDPGWLIKYVPLQMETMRWVVRSFLPKWRQP